MEWEKIAKKIEKVYGSIVDWDERFFICPECDEPIYEVDYPYIELTMANDAICPVCKELL